MYISNQLSHYGGLGRAWGVPTLGEIKPKRVMAEQMIPKKTADLSADQASYVLAAFSTAQGYQNPKVPVKGEVYWTPAGPQFSQKDVQGGKTAGVVAPPKLQSGPFVKMVRDLPKLDLDPVHIPTPITNKKVPDKKRAVHGLDGISFSSPLTWLIVLGVLGLIFIGVRRYNKAA